MKEGKKKERKETEKDSFLFFQYSELKRSYLWNIIKLREEKII